VGQALGVEAYALLIRFRFPKLDVFLAAETPAAA
jgi:hypothetical protein